MTKPSGLFRARCVHSQFALGSVCPRRSKSFLPEQLDSRSGSGSSCAGPVPCSLPALGDCPLSCTFRRPGSRRGAAPGLADVREHHTTGDEEAPRPQILTTWAATHGLCLPSPPAARRLLRKRRPKVPPTCPLVRRPGFTQMQPRTSWGKERGRREKAGTTQQTPERSGRQRNASPVQPVNSLLESPEFLLSL